MAAQEKERKLKLGIVGIGVGASEILPAMEQMPEFELVTAARHMQEAGVPYVLAPNGTAPNLERRRAAKCVFDAVFGRRVLDGAARVLAVTQAEHRQLTTWACPPNASPSCQIRWRSRNSSRRPPEDSSASGSASTDRSSHTWAS